MRFRGIDVGLRGESGSSNRFWRSYLMRVSSIATCERVTSARRCSTCASNGVGSSSASNCPALTVLLKSACRRAMTPDTCEPICTVVTAESVPVAVTVIVTLPRSTFSVL